EAGLAHAGARRHDRQLTIVQAAGHAVVAVETGGRAGDAGATRVGALDALEGLAHHVAQREDRARLLRARDVVDALFGRVDEGLRVAIARVALRCDALAG